MDTILLLADSFNGHMGDWSAGWWILMMVMMVAFWALVVVLAVWVIRSLGSRDGHEGGASASELLDQRLARGEISPDEYRTRRAALSPEPKH